MGLAITSVIYGFVKPLFMLFFFTSTQAKVQMTACLNHLITSSRKEQGVVPLEKRKKKREKETREKRREGVLVMIWQARIKWRQKL